MMKKSGLADSPFFKPIPVFDAASPSVQPSVVSQPVLPKPATSSRKLQTSRLPESETARVPDKQTSRLPEFAHYDVPDYRKMQRIEVRLTWDQNKYLDDMEALIGRDAPDGEKSDPSYRRITKNSILRVIVEILRSLDVQVDASQFKNERDLLVALNQALKERLSK